MIQFLFIFSVTYSHAGIAQLVKIKTKMNESITTVTTTYA